MSPSAPPPMRARTPFGWRTALRALGLEAPFLLGLIAAIIIAVRPGLGWFYPEGVDWEQYVDAADFLWRATEGGGFPTWRQPLHAYLVGALTGDGTYLEASALLGVGSAVGIVVAAGLLGRALADSWAGAAAALFAASMGSVALAARLVTPYPLFGALAGLAVALGVCAARWRRWPLALLAGFAASAAWAVDLKGMALVPLGLGFVLLALLPSWPRGRRWWLLLPVAFGLGLAGPAGLDHWLKQGWGIEPLPLSEQVESQRAQNLDRMDDTVLFEQPLREACADEQAVEMSLDALTNDCARAMLDDNLQHMAVHTALPDARTLWLLPLALLPALWARRSRWSLVASVLASAGALLAMFLWGLVSMLWISHGVRYVLHLAAPAAALVPVALYRLLGLPGLRWPRARLAVGPLTLGLSLAWLLWVWPAVPASELARLRGPNLPGPGETPLWSPDPRLRLVDGLVDGLAPGDTVIDCANVSVRSFLLPVDAVIEEPLPHDLRRCQELIQQPPVQDGATPWLITRHVPDDPGRRWTMAADYPGEHGWRVLERVDARPHGTPWPACCDLMILWGREPSPGG